MRLAPQEIRTYFVTAVCAGRRRIFQTTRNADVMIEVMQKQRALHRMHIHAFVLMPDHMHLLLTPESDVSLEKAMQFLKGGYSFLLKSRMDVWDRGYRERRIVSAGDYAAAAQYVESNPVRARIAERSDGYPFSSAGRESLVDPVPAWFRGEELQG